jgi:hypothetical protein
MKWFVERIKITATRKAYERTSICYEGIGGWSHYQVHARLEEAVRRKRRPYACNPCICMDLKLSACGSTASVLFWLSYGTEMTGLGIAGPSAGSDLQVRRTDLYHIAAIAGAEQAGSCARMTIYRAIDGEGTLC